MTLKLDNMNEVAEAMVFPGKGILAADESNNVFSSNNRMYRLGRFFWACKLPIKYLRCLNRPFTTSFNFEA